MVNQLLASQCAQCHGTDGYARGDYDEIAGEDAKDMFEDLTDMKGEDRPENIMDHQALGYTDDQIRRIASYYATLPEDQPGEEEESEEEAEEESGSGEDLSNGEEHPEKVESEAEEDDEGEEDEENEEDEEDEDEDEDEQD
jgi:cytochrome c553